MARLTDYEKQAVLAILHERLAGCPDDLASAIGCGKEEAVKIWNRLVNVSDKFTADLENR